MIRVVLAFVVAAVIAALFGFGMLGEYSWPGAKNFFYFFLVLAGLTLVVGTGILRKSA